MRPHINRRHLLVIFCLGLSNLLGWGVAAAPTGKSAAPPPAAPQGEASPAQKYFTDVLLVNQDGKQMRFYSDLLKGRVIIINTFFTNCTSVCPPMGATLEKIQNWLGDRLGRDAYIISISVDPATDTPPMLKDWGKKFHAKPGWFFLTGKKENVEFALKKLGQFVEARDDHSTLLIIGNERTGLWKKAFGLAKPDDLIATVESVLNDKDPGAK